MHGILSSIYCLAVIDCDKQMTYYLVNSSNPSNSTALNCTAGIKIGFPLTQTCVLIAALWGIKYFKEFDLQKSGFLFRFCMGILLILVGAYLLGTSG